MQHLSTEQGGPTLRQPIRGVRSARPQWPQGHVSCQDSGALADGRNGLGELLRWSGGVRQLTTPVGKPTY